MRSRECAVAVLNTSTRHPKHPACASARTRSQCCRSLCAICIRPAAAHTQKHEKTRREREQQVGGGQAEEIDENFIRLYWEQMLQVRA